MSYNNEFATAEEGQDLDLLDEEHATEECPNKKPLEAVLNGNIYTKGMSDAIGGYCIANCTKEVRGKCVDQIINKE